ncbi:hypothetical protein Ddc_04154 [Ditylenchus destructor]|nr:hypothetical protein Ddc_04154 [Ditylenchus destructor]
MLASLDMCALCDAFTYWLSLIALYFGIFDFLSTLTALRTKSILLKDFEDWRRARLIWILLVPVALSSSLSWLELGHIEYDHWTLLLSPILAILQGLQFVLIKKAQMDFCAIAPLSIEAEEEDEWFEDFSMHYTGWVALILFLPSLVSYSCSVISHDAAWESIDHVLMGMSIVFMASFKYSELWLQTHLDIHHFCILEHTKFFMASCGQWFLQNMAHATIYAACGKVLFVASTFRYWSNFHGLLSSRKENEA